MSTKRLWLLIEWDVREIFPKYGVVNVESLIGHKTDLHPGNYIGVRKKFETVPRRARILKTSDNKKSMKDKKVLLDRDAEKMRNMLSICLNTIQQMKSQSSEQYENDRTEEESFYKSSKSVTNTASDYVNLEIDAGNNRSHNDLNPEADIEDTQNNNQNKYIPIKTEPVNITHNIAARRVSSQTSDNGKMIPIGNGYAKVPAEIFNKINWNHYTSATKILLQAIFPKRILATHSLTGRRSPVFLDSSPKKQLDPKLTEDIIHTVASKCNVSIGSVKWCITTRLTVEDKLYQNRILSGENKAEKSRIKKTPNKTNLPKQIYHNK